MTTFVLVPGFWLGGWAWRRVAEPLRAAGHEVYPVTLTGLADRVHLAGPGVDQDTHITDVVNLIRYEDLRDVVLVGHSGGGITAYGVSDRIPERLARVVYVDSGPAPDGSSALDLQSPEQREATENQVGDGWQIPVPAFDPADPADPSAGATLTGLTEADLALLRERGTPMPYAVVRQPLRLTDPARRAVPTDLVACLFPTAVIDEMIAAGHPYFAEFGALADRRVHGLPTGHWPMLSRPADLAALLIELAGLS
jgi:pimeloyl-ACP methyl ester carboxylesterase